MGMYTALHFGAYLKNSTPQQVVDTLKLMLSPTQKDKPATSLPDHPLFGNTSWRFMLLSDSAYFYHDTHSAYHEVDNRLSITCNLKNYDGEIALFLDWIMPYVDAEPGEFLGYWMYEGDDHPTLIFYPRNFYYM